MDKIYNKLVRDRIPEIIRAEGRKCEIEIMEEAEYFQALFKKLMEEAQELAVASDDDSLVTELADVYEVLDTILLTRGLGIEEIRSKQTQRRKERGGFTQRIRLLRTE
jgi:predicted house-cleaning noncanonical NTP pyrophosphatase (MazG superfamily)